MPSTGTGYHGGLAESVDAHGALAMAAAAMARLRNEIDELWHDSMATDDGKVADRLVAISHAIRGVSHLLDDSNAIG
jgi:hypothetical protein